MASSCSSYSSSPCAACKFLRRKCRQDCVFAAYFPPEEPQKFANVHKIFGASNVSKILSEIMPHQREDAVNSLAYEAEARLKDPVYGCVGAISVLQRQVLKLQKELDATNADLIRYACNDMATTGAAARIFGDDGDDDDQRALVGAHHQFGIGVGRRVVVGPGSLGGFYIDQEDQGSDDGIMGFGNGNGNGNTSTSVGYSGGGTCGDHGDERGM